MMNRLVVFVLLATITVVQGCNFPQEISGIQFDVKFGSNQAIYKALFSGTQFQITDQGISYDCIEHVEKNGDFFLLRSGDSSICLKLTSISGLTPQGYLTEDIPLPARNLQLSTPGLCDVCASMTTSSIPILFRSDVPALLPVGCDIPDGCPMIENGNPCTPPPPVTLPSFCGDLLEILEDESSHSSSSSSSNEVGGGGGRVVKRHRKHKQNWKNKPKSKKKCTKNEELEAFIMETCEHLVVNTVLWRPANMDTDDALQQVAEEVGGGDGIVISDVGDLVKLSETQVVETLEGVFPQADPAPQPNGGYSIESLPSDMPVNIMAEQKTTDMPVEIMAEQKPIENEASVEEVLEKINEVSQVAEAETTAVEGLPDQVDNVQQPASDEKTADNSLPADFFDGNTEVTSDTQPQIVQVVLETDVQPPAVDEPVIVPENFTPLEEEIESVEETSAKSDGVSAEEQKEDQKIQLKRNLWEETTKNQEEETAMEDTTEASEPQIESSQNEEGEVTVTVTIVNEEKDESTPKRRGRPAKQSTDDVAGPSPEKRQRNDSKSSESGPASEGRPTRRSLRAPKEVAEDKTAETPDTKSKKGKAAKEKDTETPKTKSKGRGRPRKESTEKEVEQEEDEEEAESEAESGEEEQEATPEPKKGRGREDHLNQKVLLLLSNSKLKLQPKKGADTPPDEGKKRGKKKEETSADTPKKGRGRPKKEVVEKTVEDEEVEGEEDMEGDEAPEPEPKKKKGRPSKSGDSPKDITGTNETMEAEETVPSTPSKKRARPVEETVETTPTDLPVKKKPKASPPVMTDSSAGPNDRMIVKEEPQEDLLSQVLPNITISSVSGSNRPHTLIVHENVEGDVYSIEQVDHDQEPGTSEVEIPFVEVETVIETPERRSVLTQTDPKLKKKKFGPLGQDDFGFAEEEDDGSGRKKRRSDEVALFEDMEPKRRTIRNTEEALNCPFCDKAFIGLVKHIKVNTEMKWIMKRK
ncbi:unnamed protein product [Mytilus edulis]|uniref:Uncharacterized protein n=1 Tax=Mytilus edulis TaxID=6550 RepID=A0A8S3RMB7_MYTED|nr:unnamed protein product [Mytilus edulis]